MLKPIAAMTDHEMLLELMREKRRNERARNIKYMIAGAVIVLLLILIFRYLPPVVRYFQSLNATIDKIQGEMEEVQGVANGIKDSVTGLLDKLGTTFHWGTSGDPM